MDTKEISKPEAGKTTRARTWKRKAVIFCGAATFVVLVVFIGFRYFPKWNEERLVRRARNLIAHKNYNSATLTARRVLQLNNRNIDATGLMAEIADSVNARESLFWHRRLVQLQPEQIDNQLALVEKELKFGSVAAAGQVLDKVGGAGRQIGRYHELAGKIAILTKQPAKAEAEFAEATKLEPGNETFVFEYAVQSLESLQPEEPAEAQRTELEKRAEARKIVGAYLVRSEYFSRASRALISDALRNRDWDRALSLGKALAEAPLAPLDDRLVYLQVLHKLTRPQYPVELMALQEAVVASADDTSTLLSWLAANDGALLAIEWSKRLPGNLASTMPVPIAIAKAYVALGDWSGLRPIVVDAPDEEAGGSKQNWAAYEFMRLALASRTLREQGEVNASRIQWNAALKAVGGRPEALTLMARAAVDWGWTNESDELLWAVGRSSNDPRWALDVLYARYFAAKSTHNVLAVVTRMFEIDPADPWVQNNLAALNLLLQTNVEQGISLAKALYEKEPMNPVYASTYALGMHLQGRTKESIQIMRSLGPSALSDPGCAAYYFSFLVAEGEFREAETLNGRLQLSFLFPEEVELVSKARSRLSAAPKL